MILMIRCTYILHEGMEYDIPWTLLTTMDVAGGSSTLLAFNREMRITVSVGELPRSILLVSGGPQRVER